MATSCPACYDECNPPGATVCSWCGFAPLNAGSSSGSAVPALKSSFSPIWGTSIHAEITTVSPSGAGKAPGDADLYFLLAALIVGCVAPAMIRGSAVNCCCSALGLVWIIASVGAVRTIQRVSRHPRTLAEFTAKTVDGQLVTIQMVNPSGAVNVDDRIVAKGGQLPTRVFYANRAVIRSSNTITGRTCRNGVVVKGAARISPLIIGLALVGTLLFWLVIVPLLIQGALPA